MKVFPGSDTGTERTVHPLTLYRLESADQCDLQKDIGGLYERSASPCH